MLLDRIMLYGVVTINGIATKVPYIKEVRTDGKCYRVLIDKRVGKVALKTANDALQYTKRTRELRVKRVLNLR